MNQILPKPLVGGEKSRLFPVVKETSLEDRASSILLANFEIIPEFLHAVLDGTGQKVTKNTKLTCYSQVNLELPKDGKERPDGLIRLERGGKVWTALVEAKIGNAQIDKEQVISYCNLAKLNGIDAIITISNEFASIPTHHPIQLKKNEQKGVELYHWSWLHTVTKAILTLGDTDFTDPLKRHILEEFLRYFEHKDVGVNGFTKMNSEWKDVISKIQNGAPLKKTSDEVVNTVSAWHQESKDLCLIMSRELNVPVKEKLSKKHQLDPMLRLKDDAEHLCENRELVCIQSIPDAASDLKISAHLSRRSISCSMELKATLDKKTNKAQITWLTKQLSKAPTQDIQIRAWHKGSPQPEQADLSVILEDPSALIAEGKEKVLFSRFEIVIVTDLAGKFSGSKVFIEHLEEAAPKYYASVGQYLRAWVPAAPKPVALEQSPDQAAD